MPQNVAAPPAGNKPKFLDQVRDVIRRKHFSLRTERIYCDCALREGSVLESRQTQFG
jgi:hypothetical protein